ncbi:MAG: ABC transporter ATP-binding protein [Desulfobacteraceae bacterium]|nr:ABC transporter ATP-binding protein [Desulfobacteraceae bacterium]
MSLDVKDVFAGYYEDINILQGVSVSAEKGRITIVIGANGVGKSTLFKAIYGFLEPKAGKIIYNNEDITGANPYTISKKGISYIPQRRNIFPYLSVEENWEMGAWIFRKDKKRIKSRIQANYDRFPNLVSKSKTDAGALSGGEQRMVEIGRALMVDPDLILVDEPTAGLAPVVAKEIYSKLKQLNTEENKTILLVDQNIRQAMKIADYIYILELGKNKTQGSRKAFETDLKAMIKDWLF